MKMHRSQKAVMYTKETTPMLYDPGRSQTSTTLLDAADYIPMHGWCQHILRNTTGEVCLIGAIVSVGADETRHLAFQAMRNFLDTQWLSFWNNESERTEEEVIAALEEAAALA